VSSQKSDDLGLETAPAPLCVRGDFGTQGTRESDGPTNLSRLANTGRSQCASHNQESTKLVFPRQGKGELHNPAMAAERPRIGADELAGRAFCDAGSIVSMVVKNKLALPAAGDWHDRGGSYVFEPRERLKEFESLFVLPLLVRDEVMGTFTVAAQRAGAFPADRREMLGVIANQVAISLQNGRMVEALEEQATTDGLTGLVNHRTFQERFSAMLGRAERHPMRVPFLLTDIDHFKKINDTHGTIPPSGLAPSTQPHQ